MITAEIYNGISQISTVLTTLLGIVALIYITKSKNKLSEGDIRKFASSFIIFFIALLVGVSSMTAYHLTESASENISGIAEIVWYIFMFLAFTYACAGSIRLIRLGKGAKQDS